MLHKVFWGTHGCNRNKGHSNPCLCDCKSTLPANHPYVFGEDKESAVYDPRKVINPPPGTCPRCNGRNHLDPRNCPNWKNTHPVRRSNSV